ncbi:hypothetical protein C4D60_Mb08t00960 [Musa balbisiana]|uniref:Stomagen C-terminal domain-containing protein n=1 Tax=Musa balbisiana TaxID=52838 RepID=A0A4S8K0I4_MUSBA|nr:hypothetical protein C4D60_Mb08t00960 [Musa balbisiana]
MATTEGSWRWRDRSTRRLMIGSTAPTCTYNECKGCRLKCRAEQVPVDAGDPMNSAYRYRCVCHGDTLVNHCNTWVIGHRLSKSWESYQ